MDFHDNAPAEPVSPKTIHSYIYAQLRGDLRKLLTGALRLPHKARLSRSRGQDRRAYLRDVVSIHDRPVEGQWRQVAGHGKGDLLKGARNASPVGTLAECRSRLLLLAKVDGVDAEAVLDGFMRRLRPRPAGLRQTLTDD